MQESTDFFSPAMPIPPLVLPEASLSTDGIACDSHGSSHALHRLAEARKSQGVSVANLARRLAMEATEVRIQENPNTDIWLSQLYKWRDILDVPVAELLIAPEDSLDDPIKSRATLVRIMKTVRSILETTREKQTIYMAQTLFDQLVNIMPELQEVSAWPSVGQSREFKDYGQAIYRRFDRGVEQAMTE
jgi:hypothetical protein